MSISLRFLFCICFLSLTTAALGNETVTKIDTMLQSLHQSHLFDGSVLVAKEKEILFSKGYGEADREWHIPNTPEAVFLVGSVSKQFTSMLVMQLVAKKKLDLQAPITTYLPYLPADKFSKITLHHLLTHTSGLPHYRGFQAIGVDVGEYGRLYHTPEAYGTLISSLELQSEPGEAYSYSSMGYILLGDLVEKVSGLAYGKALKKYISEPLSVGDLGFVSSETLVEKLAKGYQYVWRNDGEYETYVGYAREPYRDQSHKYATGGVHASVGALFTWTQALQDDTLLEKDDRDKMFTPFKNKYAYGWRILDGTSLDLDPAVKIVSHGGSLAGYRASVLMVNDGQYTVILLANNGNTPSGDITGNIVKILFDKEPGSLQQGPVLVAEAMLAKNVYAGRTLHKQLRKQAENYDFSQATYNNTGYRLLRLGRYNAAVAMFKLAIDTHPEAGNLYDSLGEVYIAMGENKKSIAAYKKAIELAEANPETNRGVAENARKMLAELKK